MLIPAAWNLSRIAECAAAGVRILQSRKELRTASLAAATSAGVGVLIGSGYTDGGGGTAGPLFGPAGSVFAEASSISETPLWRTAWMISSTLSRPGVRRR